MNLVHWSVPTKVVKLFENRGETLVISSDLMESGGYSQQAMHLMPVNFYSEWVSSYGDKSSTIQPVILIGEFDDSTNNVIGFISDSLLNLSDQELDFIIESYIRSAQLYYLEQEVDQVSLEMDKMREQIFSELALSKKIYQKVVPVRKDKLESAIIASKFESGLKGGGEFFDWKENKGTIFL